MIEERGVVNIITYCIKKKYNPNKWLNHHARLKNSYSPLRIVTIMIVLSESWFHKYVVKVNNSPSHNTYRFLKGFFFIWMNFRRLAPIESERKQSCIKNKDSSRLRWQQNFLFLEICPIMDH
jgi:hypothetical protein